LQKIQIALPKCRSPGIFRSPGLRDQLLVYRELLRSQLSFLEARAGRSLIRIGGNKAHTDDGRIPLVVPALERARRQRKAPW